MSDQHEHLEQIDKNLSEAEQLTHDGVFTLAKTSKEKNNAAVYRGAAIGGVIMGSVGFLLGPLGGVVGSTTGMTIGT